MIHYCWFGKENYNQLINNCINSWRRFFKGYKLCLWNEENFNVDKCKFTIVAYKTKKYAFVSDYVRLYALYNYGGLYFDTDFEVLKPFDEILSKKMVIGFESENNPSTAMIYSPPKNKIIGELLDFYDNYLCMSDENNYCLQTNVEIVKKHLLSHNIKMNNSLQETNDLIIFPRDWFSPLDFETGKLNLSDNTRGIHNYCGSWLSEDQKDYFNLKREFGKIQAKKIVAQKSSFQSNHIIKYSIIVTFYDNIKILSACLDRLAWSLKHRDDTEIILINDNPEINLNNYIDNPNIRLINLAENKGYSGACNEGRKYACGNYLIFIDSDILVSFNWLEAIERTAYDHPDFGAICAKILRMQNNTIEYFGMYMYENDSIKPRLNFHDNTSFTANDRCCQIITSGCMLIRKEVFDSIQGFDENLYNSHCDLDLSLRLIPKKNYISASSIVYHRSTTSGAIRTVAYAKARSLFYKKWSNLNMNDITLNALAELYSEFKSLKTSNYYIMINFCSSVFCDAYIETLANAMQIEIIQRYNIRISNTEKINIMDKVSWLINFEETPILYFCDQFGSLIDNFLWFNNRKFNKDLIADINGNIISVNSIIKK